MKILTLAEHLKSILNSRQGEGRQVRLQYIADGEPRTTKVDLIAVRNGGVHLRSSAIFHEGKTVLLLVDDISEQVSEKRRGQSIESKMIISKATPDEEYAGKFILSAEFVGNYRIKGGEAKR